MEMVFLSTISYITDGKEQQKTKSDAFWNDVLKPKLCRQFPSFPEDAEIKKSLQKSSKLLYTLANNVCTFVATATDYAVQTHYRCIT